MWCSLKDSQFVRETKLLCDYSYTVDPQSPSNGLAHPDVETSTIQTSAWDPILFPIFYCISV